MNDRIETKASLLKISGDADVIYVAPLRVNDGRECWEERPLAPKERLRKADAVTERLRVWRRGTSNTKLESVASGQDVLVRNDPLDEAVGRYELKEELLDRLSGELTERVGPVPPPEGLRVEIRGVMARWFSNGIVSLAVHLLIPRGWDDQESLERVFGREARANNVVSRALEEVLVSSGAIPSSPVAELMNAISIECRPWWSKAIDWSSLRCPYFHVIYAGRTPLTQPGRAHLHDSMRSWVYPADPHPVRSCSPHLDEFVFPGYAFTLLVASENAPLRTGPVLELVQIVQARYHHLEEACSRLEERLISDESLSVRELDRLDRHLKLSYRQMATSTFTYNHHVLRLRDTLISEWQIRGMLDRATYVIEAIRSRERSGRDRWLRRLQWILGIIGVLAVLETAAAVLDLYERYFSRGG